MARQLFKLTGILTLASTLFFAQVVSATDLQPYEAVYLTKARGFKVHLKRRLQIQDSKITLTVDAKRFWFGMHESSELIDHGDGQLCTVKYVHDRSGSGNEHDKDLVFNWTNNTVHDLLHPERAPLSVEFPSYDKLGFQVQMRLDMLLRPDEPEYKYTVSNAIRNRQYTFTRIGEEVLKTPLGKLRTAKFQRTGDDDERVVFVWVALDWQFLLARIDETKKPGGKTVRLELEKATIAGKPVTGL